MRGRGREGGRETLVIPSQFSHFIKERKRKREGMISHISLREEEKERGNEL